MWDVNEKFEIAIIVSTRFDLNYVGCEHFYHLLGVSYIQKFDLNYVGCEHFFNLDRDVDLFRV